MPKRTPLVCQHLENISREALEKHQDMVRQYVRRRQGVYALYRRGKLYYVGLASNLRSRLKHHLKDRHHDSWDRFSVYITISDGHLRELEALILRIIKPPGNKQKGKFAKSEDLRRRFKRDLKADMLSTLDELLGRKVKDVGERSVDIPIRGRKPRLAKFIARLGGRHTLRAKFKGETYRANVRKTGLIWFAKTHFTSPSHAAYRVTKRASNGWRFWHPNTYRARRSQRTVRQ